MRARRAAVLSPVLALALVLAARTDGLSSGYRVPPQPIPRILGAPALPEVVLDPTGRVLLLAEAAERPRIEDVARRVAAAPHAMESAGGIHPAGHAGFLLKHLDFSGEARVVHPDGAELGTPLWAPDGRRVAFAVAGAGGDELWVTAVERPQARRVTEAVLQRSSRRACDWMPDARRLLCRTRVQDQVTPVAAPAPLSPFTIGPDTLPETFGSTRRSARTQLVLVDVASRERQPVGPPLWLDDVAPSPDGAHLLVEHRPGDGAPVVEVWATDGRPIRRLEDQTAAATARGFRWAVGEPATLVWAERTASERGRRDRVMRLPAPFEERPAALLELEGAFAGMQWTAAGEAALVYEYERRTRRRRTWIVDGTRGARLLWDVPAGDHVSSPGTPLETVNAAGQATIACADGAIFLAGSGARAFLDRLDLETLRRRRLWQGSSGRFEVVTGVLSAREGRFLVRHESATQPPNHAVLDLRDDSLRDLTHLRDPFPELREIGVRVLRYERDDGIPLAATLYVPARRAPDERLPLVVWAYPTSHSGPRTTAQMADPSQRYGPIDGVSPPLLATQGYAVLHPVAMPVVGPPDVANDTFVRQIVANAEAAVRAAVETGTVDPGRVVIAGHSYGAFMAVTLLAHSDLFRAGIALSGSYNRTLTPFGFQTERRTLWEATDTYLRMSPLLNAHRVAEPLLLIHGEQDDHPGTPAVQSRSLYEAVRATGGTARLVVLPFEGHVYRAQESALHVLAEILDWLDRYVKRPPSGSEDAVGQTASSASTRTPGS